MKKLLTLGIISLTTTVFGQIKQMQDLTDFLPKGYVVFDKIIGDLNKDGIEDCILVIKGTNKNEIITDEYLGQLDRNRRGIIVLLKKNNQYELAIKNDDCFSSENEEGAGYYAPQLSVEIKKGNLYIKYEHGKYGYWEYNFRFQNLDFELIGYDEINTNGPVINSKTSVNFLTKRQLVEVNTNENADSGEERFKTTTKKIDIKNNIKLSEIKDFDEFHMTMY